MTIREMYNKGMCILKDNNVLEADIDAKYLLLHCMDISIPQFYMNAQQIVDKKASDRYFELIDLRATHYPLQYIIGTQEFMGLEFEVNENVLIPRQDTEVLVEKVIEIAKQLAEGKVTPENNVVKDGDSDFSILDMCTGSGCIAISTKRLLKDAIKNISVTAVDISDMALEVARRNAINNEADIEFVESDLFENVTGRYDIIVSNPPYIETETIKGLMEEVRQYEPFIALDGKEDGLYFYRKIIDNACKYLKNGGYLCFEIGCEQANSVKELMLANRFCDIEVIKDIPGLDRVVLGKLEVS